MAPDGFIMAADGALASSALDVMPMGEYRETLKTANRAVSAAVDFSLTTGILILVAGVFLFIILLLLAERRSDRKAQSKRDDAREKAAEERYKIDSARQDRDILSRDNLAEALQDLAVLIRTQVCKTDHTTPQNNTPPRLLPKPDAEPSL